MSDDHENIRAILDLGAANAEPQVLDLEHDGIEAKVIAGRDEHGGITLDSIKPFIDEWRERPERRKGNLLAHDLESFIALVNRDSFEGESVVFADVADRKSPKLVAVIDFHDRRNATLNEQGLGVAAQANWCQERVSYAFPLSDEWKVWNARNGEGQKMTTEVFAAFIEDRLFDIGEPQAARAISLAFAAKLGVSFTGPAGIMALSRGLDIRVESRLAKATKLESGETVFAYEETHLDKNGAPLRVPAAFHLMIPVFRGGPLYSIPVRLRYRTQGSTVFFFFEMHNRADTFFDDAVKDTVERVRRPQSTAALATPEAAAPESGCGLLTVLGSPP